MEGALGPWDWFKLGIMVRETWHDINYDRLHVTQLHPDDHFPALSILNPGALWEAMAMQDTPIAPMPVETREIRLETFELGHTTVRMGYDFDSGRLFVQFPD